MTTSSSATPLRPRLSPYDVARFRSLLLGQLAAHRALVDESRATIDELTGQSDSDSLLEREIAEEAAAHFAVAVCEAQGALRRLDDGVYGVCEACAAPIPFARLEAIPYARRCVACPAAPVRLSG